MSTRAQLLATVAADFPTNGVELITAADARNSLDDMINSTWVPSTDGTPLVAPTLAGINSITSAAGSGLTLATLDTNKPITVSPNGTGSFIVTAATSAFNVAAGVTPFCELEVDSTSASSPRGIMSAQFSTDTGGARLHLRKARGTRAAPTIIVSGDNLGRLVGTGYDGAAYLEMASIYFGTEGTIGTNRVPTNISFWTATNAGPSVLTQALVLTSAQNATLTGNLTFGSSASILNGTTGSIGLTAIGTNQNITLTPSGTGFTAFGPASLTSAVRIGAVSDATTFGIITFNGVMAGATMNGFQGGGDANLYYRTTGAHRWLVGGSTILTLNATASALAMTGTFNLSGVATLASGTATPANGSVAARLVFGTTAGFGIYYGSGNPTVSAAQGSIYLKSDGSGIADRLWVNTNGTTGWTNFVTAA